MQLLCTHLPPPRTTATNTSTSAYGSTQLSTQQGSADVAAGGISDIDGKPWATDMFLSGYGPCDTADPPTGVCPDSTLNSDPKSGDKLESTPATIAALDNVKLVSGSRINGITTLRLRRPVKAADALDHPLDLQAPLNFIWAQGSLTAPGGGAAADPALRLKQHGANKDTYGTLSAFKLGLCPATCPKLTAVATVAPAPAPTGNMPSVLLAGGGGRVSWMLRKSPVGAPGVVLFFQALRPSQWASLAVGTEMVGARAYVAWRDDKAGGKLLSAVFDISGLSASSLKRLPPTAPAANVSVAYGPHGGILSIKSDSNKALSFQVWVPLTAGKSRLPLVWALGNSWMMPPTADAQVSLADT